MPSIRKLKVYPDPILHEVSQPVEQFDDELKTLVDDMFITMEATDGAGLSAVQVGILQRVVVMDCGNPTVLINPRITERLGEYTFEEGCLSVPGVFEERVRSQQVHVDFYDTAGGHHLRWFKNLEAFCIQHEIDHLDGKVFIDDLSSLKKKRARDKIKKTVNQFQKDIIKHKAY